MDNPLDLFQQWLDDAKGYDTIDEPTSMTLATINSDGYPDTRVVLLKDVDDSGFVFYTNLTSTKATQLQQTPKAALNFHWMPLNRQVRIQGSVTPVTNAEADEYFASRPRQSQLGAWASKQSQPVESRLELEKRLAKYTAKFHVGSTPPRILVWIPPQTDKNRILAETTVPTSRPIGIYKHRIGLESTSALSMSRN